VEVLSAGSPIKALLYEEEKELLLTITVNMMLYQHTVSSDNVATAVSEFKLSGKLPLRDAIQVCPGCLATCSNENMIRVWDLARDENYILDLSGIPDVGRSSMVNTIGYSKAKGILAAGTSNGHVIMWQFKGSQFGQKRVEVAELWEKLASSKVEGSILMLKWGANKNLIAVNTNVGVQILNENVMNSHYWQQVGGVQVAPGHLSIESFTVGAVQDLKTDIHIKGVFVSKDHVTVWNGKRVVVYELQPLVRVAGTFSCESMTVVVSDTNVYSVEGDVVQVRNFQGIIKQSLSFTEVEGAPLLLDICKSFLVVGTFNGYIKLWDISRREAKQHFSAKCMAELIESFAGLVSIKCNCTGTRISVIANQVDRGKAVPSPQIYIWDADLDTLLSFDFSTASNSSNGTEDDDCVVTGREELVKDVRDRYPVSHYWDGSDSRLLICEAKRLSERDKPNLVASKTDTQSETFKGVMVVSLFATPENGVLLHDSIPLDSKYTGLIGIDIPYLYFCKKVCLVIRKCDLFLFSKTLIQVPF
jgi:intraflagellar transport protein 140